MNRYIKRIAWLSASLLGCLVLAVSAQGASFDCVNAGTKVEHLICDNPPTSKRDEDLNVVYKAALQDQTQADSIKQAQKEWLTERNRCKDAGCVWQAYQKRLSVLPQSYTLAMSKDEKLCNAVFDLYNEEIKAYGRKAYWSQIEFDQHELFAAIKWQVDKELELEHAFFDINNDGKNELVIKNNSRLRGHDNDHLLIYPENSDVLSKMKPGSGGLRGLFDTPNQLFSLNNNLYYLKALPQTFGTEVVGGIFSTKPFIWKGTNYLSMTDERSRWIVIAKYKQAEELQDICYFLNRSIYE